MPNDIEMGNKAVPQSAGYAQWASLLASDPDSETFVFRKFNELSALNILFLQSEMFEIESQLKGMDQEAIKNGDMSQLKAIRQWETIVTQCNEPQGFLNTKRKMDLILKLRFKIKEYRKSCVLGKGLLEASS